MNGSASRAFPTSGAARHERSRKGNPRAGADDRRRHLDRRRIGDRRVDLLDHGAGREGGRRWNAARARARGDPDGGVRRRLRVHGIDGAEVGRVVRMAGAVHPSLCGIHGGVAPRSREHGRADPAHAGPCQLRVARHSDSAEAVDVRAPRRVFPARTTSACASPPASSACSS